MEIEVTHGDALETGCDVLVLKYAQALYGVDKFAVQRLEATGSIIAGQLPKPGGFRLFSTGGALGAANVLFVGVPRLREFDYAAIREFSRRALVALAGSLPATRHVAITLHGPGYGLDEMEAFHSELAGLFDAQRQGDVPEPLERITVVERNAGRALRLQTQLAAVPLPKAVAPVHPDRVTPAAPEVPEVLQSAGSASGQKPHIFVAMPFAAEFNDRFHYGIQRAVNGAGYLCERADLATFTGDVVAWVKDRIASCALLVADLSTANPNVYLEVGYAWGLGIRTVLLANDVSELLFDVKGQRCLEYQGSIQKLEDALNNELAQLK